MLTNIFILLLVVAAAWIVYRYFRTDRVIKTEYSDTTVVSDSSRPVVPAEPVVDFTAVEAQPLDYVPVVKKKRTRKKKTSQTKTK